MNLEELAEEWEEEYSDLVLGADVVQVDNNYSWSIEIFSEDKQLYEEPVGEAFTIDENGRVPKEEIDPAVDGSKNARLRASEISDALQGYDFDIHVDESSFNQQENIP